MTWQPIETAPKSAEEYDHFDVSFAVLLWFPPEMLPRCGARPSIGIAYWDRYYAPGGYGYDEFGGGLSGWVCALDGAPIEHVYSALPTHWMPLPPPPEGAE